MPMRAMWKGSVSFGLVSIPIHLYAATEDHNVTFRQVHAEDGGRIQYKRVCSLDGQEVAYRDIAKGYETPDGGMVVLTDADLADLPLPTSKGIEVVEFVPLEAIDPIQFDRSYYLEPQKAAIKPYILLRDALHKSGRVAVVQVVLRQRESLAVLRVYSDVLVLTTMLWPDEVRTPAFGFLQEETPAVRSQEMTMAGTLIESMSDDVFDPGKYTDHYQEALQDLIDAKISGKEVSRPRTSEADDTVVDLVAALQASVSAASKGRGRATPARTEPAKTRKTPAKTTARTTAKSTTRTAPKKATDTGTATPRARRTRKDDG